MKTNQNANELSKGLKFYFYPHLFSLVDKERTGIIINNIRGKTVLDAGSGRGNISLCAWKAGFDVTAIDLSKSSLNDAAFLFKYENAGIPLIEASLTNIPLQDKTFDTVICTAVIEHIPEPHKVLSELRRVLKDGGRLITEVPNARTFGLFYDKFVTKLMPEKKQSPFAYKRYFKITEEEISQFGWDNKIIFSHCQEFTLKTFKNFLNLGGFNIIQTRAWRFLNLYLRSIGTLLGLGPVNFLERMDLAIARYIPHELAPEWLFVCEKR